MPRFLRFNLYPLSTQVFDSDGNPQMANAATRNVVTDDEIYVYTDSSEGPAVWFTGRLDDFSGDATNGWTVETSEGQTVKFTRTTGCGCGSRLKGFNPFPGVPFGKVR